MCQGVITVLRSSFQLDQLDILLVVSQVAYCMTDTEQKDMPCCLFQLSLVLCVSRVIMHAYSVYMYTLTNKLIL